MHARHLISLLSVLTMLFAPSTDFSGAPRATGAVQPALRTARTATLPALNNGQPRLGRAPHLSLNQLPLVIDGEKMPQSIPDYVAYRHFVMAAAIPDRPSSEEISRRDGLLAQLHLSKEDHAALVRALATVRDGLNRIDEERRKWSDDAPASRAVLATLRAQRDALLQNAHGRLQESLTPDGLTRLETYVHEHVKSRIKIYGQLPG